MRFGWHAGARRIESLAPVGVASEQDRDNAVAQRRTMQVEVDLDNRAVGMLPGTFAHVAIHVMEPRSPLISSEAFVIRGGKTMVVEIKDGKANCVDIELGYNDGRDVRVLRGLSGGETIGLDVPVEVDEGGAVQVIRGDGT